MSEEIKYLSLLPCAFCGGEAKAFLSFHGNSSFVKCMNRACEVYTPPIPMGKNVTAIWNTRTPPELPPVSPEDLVEGEWYAWKSAGNIHVGQVYSCGTDSTYIRCGATGIPVMDWNLYYGPLKFKIRGAE